MNIQQAKQSIANTVRAYLCQDELGRYRIPPMRQRPVLLMGPPGIGKTQIMAQIAQELDVGLVSYTITHHTRQSAMGLPFLQERTFQGETHTTTAYTMSEILASVHQLMEDTGLRQGILFLDEINCVSETLAPMMLQFLQCKTFGNQTLPQGWVIVGAGNPPEYNKSVRDFDVVTLDRMKRIDVTAEFDVWKTYASRQGIHGAIVTYLDMKKENFYRMEASPEGMQFATARGWEDLSQLMQAYEALGLAVDRQVVAQYIQLPAVARDFALYLELYEKYRKTYQVEAILSGKWDKLAERTLSTAPFDEQLSVVGLLLSCLGERAHLLRQAQGLTTALHGALSHVKQSIASGAQTGHQAILALVQAREEARARRKAAGQTEDDLLQREQVALEGYASRLAQEMPENEMDALRGYFAQQVASLEETTAQTEAAFDNAFAFLEAAVGDSQVLVLFVTTLTAGYDTAWYVETYGSQAYFRHNKALLLGNQEDQLRQKILNKQKDSVE